MRATCLVLFAFSLCGCGKIDSSRSNTAIDASPPSVTRQNETARPATTPSGGALDTATAPATRSTDTAVGESDAVARPNSVTQRDSATQPDNTAVNARDADRATRNPKQPIDQNENQSDIDLTAKIRQQVLKADGMSVNARNCKIITADGRVTLRGPVNSAAEHDTIVKIAREMAGESNVDDQLEVTPANR